MSALIENSGSQCDSAVEGDGFEPSVPRKRDPLFKSAHQWQRAVHNELCDRRNDQVLDAARFKQRNGANEASFVGRTKKLLEIRAAPSSVPARESWALYRKAARHPSDFATEASRYALTG